MLYLLRTYSFIIPYALPHLRWIIFSTLLLIPLAILKLTPLTLVQDFVKECQQSTLDATYTLSLASLLNTAQEHARIPLYLTFFYALYAAIKFMNKHSMRRAVILINESLKNKGFEALLYRKNNLTLSSSEWTNRIVSDINYIDAGLSAISSTLREIIQTITFLIYGFKSQATLTGIILLILPFMLWLIKKSGHYTRKNFHQLSHNNGVFTELMQHTFKGYGTVKSFSLESSAMQMCQKTTSYNRALMLNLFALKDAIPACMDFISMVGLSILLIFAAVLTKMHALDPQQILIFFSIYTAMLPPLKNFNQTLLTLYQAAAAIERVKILIQYKAPVLPLMSHHPPDTLQIRDLPLTQGNTLRDIFTLGDIILISGPSGSGKSTLLRQIAGLSHENNPHITLWKANTIIPWSPQWVAWMDQENFLYSGSIQDNITAFQYPINPALYQQCLTTTQAMKGIDPLAEHKHFTFAEFHNCFSPGQLQRICLARALYKPSPLLLLDEPTSSLDAAMTSYISTKLAQQCKNRITFIVSHDALFEKICSHHLRLSLQNSYSVEKLIGSKSTKKHTHDANP